MDVPEVRYARSGEVNIAYQVVGDGPFDLVVVPGSTSHLEVWWEEEERASFIHRLTRFARVLMFDKRGTGLSDAVAGLPDLETRMDDVRAVMDAAGSRRAAVLGMSEGAPMTLVFAATYPERTAAIVIWGGPVTGRPTPDTPWVPPREERLAAAAELERSWGTLESGVRSVDRFAPSRSGDVEEARRWARWSRYGASPGAAAALVRMNIEIDVRHVLPTIRVPTLIVHRTGDRAVDVRNGRLMADRIPGARFVELPGDDHYPMVDPEPFLSEVELFLTGLWRDGAWAEPEPDRVLATVLFTDIVGATQKAAELGDAQWRRMLSDHHALVRGQLSRFRGRELDTAGDGFFASFDGPARAIRCACAITDSVGELGLEVRAGLHTGECELMEGKFGGIAVHIGARVAAEAAAGEVLVSSTVKDLVAGSNLEFAERGPVELKGLPGEWQLFAVERV
jgi:pimeloyl-ACP methyl ester carboxylesterase/class 3 adenylate cyclase